MTEVYNNPTSRNKKQHAHMRSLACICDDSNWMGRNFVNSLPSWNLWALNIQSLKYNTWLEICISLWCICVCLCSYIYTYVHVCMPVSLMHICMCKCVLFSYIYTYVQVYMHVFFMHICMRVCVCMCVHTSTHRCRNMCVDIRYTSI